MELTFSIIVFIFVVGFISSFVQGMAGGGGALLSIPALLFIGLPPHSAIATTKFGALGSGLSSSFRFFQAKKIHFKYVLPLTLIGMVGTVIGAMLLLQIEEQSLNAIIGVLMLLLLSTLFLGKNFGLVSQKRSKVYRYVGYFVFFLVAIYGGFFGAAGGVVIVLAFAYFFGLTLVEANGTTRIPWFIDLMVSTVIFVFAGIINYEVGIVLLIGRIFGGYLGAHIAITKGSLWVKGAIAVVVVASSVKLLFFG